MLVDTNLPRQSFLLPLAWLTEPGNRNMGNWNFVNCVLTRISFVHLFPSNSVVLCERLVLTFEITHSCDVHFQPLCNGSDDSHTVCQYQIVLSTAVCVAEVWISINSPFLPFIRLSHVLISWGIRIPQGVSKDVLVWLLGTRFEARKCISEPGHQEPSLKRPFDSTKLQVALLSVYNGWE
jgi:hypothetical protein